MDLRVDIVTLGVPDLASAREFYVDRLGWEPAFTVPGEVTFLSAAGAAVRKPPQQADWGGYHAHVEASDGTVWELAHNPGWRIDILGTAHIGPIDWR